MLSETDVRHRALDRLDIEVVTVALAIAFFEKLLLIAGVVKKVGVCCCDSASAGASVLGSSALLRPCECCHVLVRVDFVGMVCRTTVA